MQETPPVHSKPADKSNDVSNPILVASQQSTSTPKPSNQQKNYKTNTPLLLIAITIGAFIGVAIDAAIGDAIGVASGAMIPGGAIGGLVIEYALSLVEPSFRRRQIIRVAIGRATDLLWELLTVGR
jgi:hypothetical protein